MRQVLLALLCAATAAVPASRAAAPPVPHHGTPRAPSAAKSVDFRAQIAPFLAANCASCHGPTRTSSFSVISIADLMKGGEKAGPAVIPGDSRKSPIVEYLRGRRTPPMPLGGKAPEAQIVLIERWIDGGAKVDGHALPGPAKAAPLGPAKGVPPAPTAGWAFHPPVRRPVPRIRNAAWGRNPIDAFVLAKLEAKGLHPAPEASRRTLIRRATFDLLGLPPTPEEVRTFVADPHPDAYERLIDRLLASPHYGERWGRHWLDLARYADTNGYENDGERPNAWRFRDYVIRSFNNDKPFDRFIEEQIAGDELWPGDPDALIATGFLGNSPWDELAFDKKAQRNDFLTDIADTTGSVFLGLTVGCARCHNHKYDPITQKDYYSLQAFFAQVHVDDRPLPEAPSSPADKSKDGKPSQALTVRAVVDSGGPAPAHYLLVRGDVNHPGDEVQPAFIAALAKGATPAIRPALGGKSTGRRAALARWLASPGNPQTARVIVNRVWQGHFGYGIVRTPSDFGRNGDPPTHPELLDWLAVAFSSPLPANGAGSPAIGAHGTGSSRSDAIGGWSLKRLHRLIMTSSTYRQSTAYDVRCAKVDPDNRLLWRMNRQRLEGEEIRDAILSASGRLNEKMGGPGVYPEVEPGVLDTGSTHKWGQSPPEERLRRTVYVFQRRSVVLPIVEVFDGADMAASCPRRLATTIAPQALTLLNSDFTQAESRRFAERVAREAGPDPSKQIDRAFLIALGRSPSPAERRDCLAFLKRQAGLHPATANGVTDSGAQSSAAVQSSAAATDGPARAALGDLCHVLLNTNEFVYIE